jgi:hypothetical protein
LSGSVVSSIYSPGSAALKLAGLGLNVTADNNNISLSGGLPSHQTTLPTMNSNPQPPYPPDGVYPAQEQDIGVLPHRTYPDPTEQPIPAHANPYSNSYAQPEGNGNKYEPMRPPDASFNGAQESEVETKKTSLLGKKISKKWQRRLYWLVSQHSLAKVEMVY